LLRRDGRACRFPALADGMVENVNGITLDKDGKVVRFSALLIDKEGKVSQLLTSKEKAPKQLDFRHDGRGLTMLPGLIDAHGHVMGLGFAALTLDLSNQFAGRGAGGDQGLCRQISRRRWIIGRGWNQEKWGLGPFPDRCRSGCVVPDRPSGSSGLMAMQAGQTARRWRLQALQGATKSPPAAVSRWQAASPAAYLSMPPANW
jgi:hypothetical protein